MPVVGRRGISRTDTTRTAIDSPEGEPPQRNVSLNSLFSLRRPRDVGAGMISGTKSAAKGVIAGLSALIITPILGAKDSGVPGFLWGTFHGLLAGVAFPIMGISIGTLQVIRGVVNTPEAMYESYYGKEWDNEHRQWKIRWYSLSEEKELLESTQTWLGEADKADNKTEYTNKLHTVKDTALYEILHVDPHAGKQEIKKQYYKLSRDYHPDKNRDDPNAKEKFQELSKAYQILGDEDRRAKYDREGSAALNEIPIIDGALFFAILFGTEALNEFVGKLKMAMCIELLENTNAQDPLYDERLRHMQRVREVNLACLLIGKIPENLSDTSIEEWLKQEKERIESLMKMTFADSMLSAVGWMYQNAAETFIQSHESFFGIGGKISKIQAKGRSITNNWKATVSVIKAAVAATNVEKKEGNVANIEDIEGSLPIILDTMLAFCLLDIEKTTKNVVKRVLRNDPVPLDRRLKIAKAISKYGNLLQTVGDEHIEQNKGNGIDPRTIMEQAFRQATG